jgi:hypothetical protein
MLSAFVRGVVTRSRLVLLRPANRFYSLSSVVRQSNPHSTAQIVGSVLRKPARRRRSLTSLYARQQEDAFLPKVIGQARADSYDLPGIMEDEHINSRYSITFVDDGNSCSFYSFTIFRC